VFNTFIRHWKKHLKKSLELLLEGVQSGLETGNIEDACYCATHYCGYLFLSGENLENVIQKQRQYIDLMVQYKQEIQIHHAQIWGQTVLNLIGDSANPVQLTGKLFDEETSLPSLIQANDNQGIFAIYLVKSFLCYLFKDYDRSLKNSVLTNKYGTGFLGTSYIPLHNFYYSLTLLALYSTSTRRVSARKIEL
jgi:predicted ATPase